MVIPGYKVLKKYFMLNLAEHETLNAHKYKDITKAFSGSYKLRMLFFLLKISNIYEQEKFHAQLSCSRFQWKNFEKNLSFLF